MWLINFNNPNSAKDILLYKQLYEKLMVFFNGDMIKINNWHSTPTPLFGDLSPNQMMTRKRTKKMVEIALHELGKNIDVTFNKI